MTVISRKRSAPGQGADLWSADKNLALSLHAGEAIAAVNRAIGLRLERDTRFAAAGSAGSGEVLSGAAGSVLAGVTAGLAALRLILEATLCVEFLLTGSENELFATLFADQRLVFEHFCYLSFAIKNGFALQLRLALGCDRAVYAIRLRLISPGKAPVNLARVHTRREGATD